MAQPPEKRKVMRLDKYLKVSRIIKRRTVANEVCDAGHICVGGRTVKASYDVKEGDILEIRFGEKVSKYRVLSVSEYATKQSAADMYEEIK